MDNKTCVLIPLTGLEWNGQTIRFGDSREAVEQILGEAEVVRGSHYYFNKELRFDFDDNGGLKFIECLGGMDGGLQPELCGVPAFQTDAEELLELLKGENDGDIDDSEAEYEYRLLNISVGLYREITPADMDGMLLEMSNMDLTNMGDIRIEEETRRAHHWDTIGIGAKDYYA